MGTVFVSCTAGLVLPQMKRISHYNILTGCSSMSFTGSLNAMIARQLVSAVYVIFVTNVAFLLRVPIFLAFFRRAKAGVPSVIRLLASM